MPSMTLKPKLATIMPPVMSNCSIVTMGKCAATFGEKISDQGWRTVNSIRMNTNAAAINDQYIVFVATSKRMLVATVAILQMGS